MTTIADKLRARGRHPNVLITGVSTGMGYDSVGDLINEGFVVFGSVRKEADAKRLQADFGDNFHPLIFDVVDEQAVTRVVSVVEQQLDGEGLCCLVNNAGIGVLGPLQHLSIDEVKFQFEVNTFGPLRVIQAFLPLLGAQLPHQYPPGKIINISSVSGLFAAAFVGAYAMSKFALEAMTDSLRRELCIYDIDVMSIQPGAIATEIIGKAEGVDPRFLETDYGPILQDWDKRVAQTDKNALPGSAISEAILHCIIEDKPAVRHLVAKREALIRSWLEASERDLDQILAGKYKAKVMAAKGEME